MQRNVAFPAMESALITGGTSGIGLAFARALAAEGTDLVLVARDQARLDAVAAELSDAHGVRVETLAADLASRDDQERVAARLREGVDILVNNAGFSFKTPLVSGDTDLADRAWEVMGRAPRVLGDAAASAMIARGHGRIITTASVSGLTRQDGYSALKAYVLAWSEVLSNELTGTGVTATAVLPGWVHTEFHDRGGHGKSSIPGFLWLEPDEVAAAALADARRGKVISVPSRRYQALVGILGLLPRSGVRSISRALAGHRRRDRKTPVPGGDK